MFDQSIELGAQMLSVGGSAGADIPIINRMSKESRADILGSKKPGSDLFDILLGILHESRSQDIAGLCKPVVVTVPDELDESVLRELRQFAEVQLPELTSEMIEGLATLGSRGLGLWDNIRHGDRQWRG